MKAGTRTLTAVAAAVPALSAYANRAHDMLSGMSEEARRKALATFISNGGEKCPSVTRTFYQGSDKQGNAYWNVDCTGAAS